MKQCPVQQYTSVFLINFKMNILVKPPHGKQKTQGTNLATKNSNFKLFSQRLQGTETTSIDKRVKRQTG